MAQERVDNLFASESWSAVYTAFTNISLKAYDFDSIREALLTYVSQTYPDKFNDFVSSSEFIAILDLVAYLGHSLAYRSDMNARENFLDTAERRQSILRIAKSLGYNKTRPINARGFMKITGIKTNQTIYDSNGVSLANKNLIWNDSNNPDWYDNFVTVLNSALSNDSKVEDPAGNVTILGIENYMHYINEDPATKSVRYSFNSDIAGKTRTFEAVRAKFNGDIIEEAEPNISRQMTIISRNDNLGPASDRSGFFMFAKAGQIKFKDVNYDVQLSNRIETIIDTNISNSDVWVQRLDTNGKYVNEVIKVDNETRETAIYNSLRYGNGDLVNVNTLEDNRVELVFSDGIFGNAAYGRYRIWYRIADNESYTVNRNDIKNVKITIPYIAADTKKYNLTITLSSTRDFVENFEGENYLSVKRIAPRSYYAQDRMVNAQDYNVLPLSLGTNVISKIKAVNTTYAGKSRFIEMDDVTGHHSNVHVIGNDGSVYIEDDVIRLRMPFSIENGNVDDFIRNTLGNVLKHPSLVNKFFIEYMDDPKFDNDQIDASWISDITNPLKGNVSDMASMGGPVTESDFLKISDNLGENTAWYKILYVDEFDNITLDKVAPNGGLITHIVKSPRMRLTDQEVSAIKEYVINSGALSSFVLWFDAESLAWQIQADNLPVNIDAPGLVNFSVRYVTGARKNSSEFVVEFTGTKVVFESRDEVKFFYSNGRESVIDMKTNLEKRDSISITYKSDAELETGLINSTTEDTITVGYAPLKNISTVTNQDESVTATFETDFTCTGAVSNYEFINDPTRPEIVPVSYTHTLISPDCVETVISTDTDTVIGSSPAYTVSYTVENIQDVIVTLTEVEVNVPVELDTDFVLSNVTVDVLGEASGNLGNVAENTSAYVSLTGEQFTTMGLKGTPSASYFSNAMSNNLFYWIDASELPAGITPATAEPGMTGVQVITVNQYDSLTDTYTFIMPNGETWQIDENDSDIYFKQKNFGSVEFISTDPIEYATAYVKDMGLIDKVHWELVDLGENAYKIVFWSKEPTTETVTVYKGSLSTIEELSNYFVRVDATLNVNKVTVLRDRKYNVVDTYVYDKYVTSSGYVDYSKVKLLTLSKDNNPYGVIDIFRNDTISSYIIIEDYAMNNNTTTRVSKTAIAAGILDEKPADAILWYNTDEISEYKWFRKSLGVWVQILDDAFKTGNIVYNTKRYRVVEGRSYVEDAFMSFRWDHYADADKRIDPTSSNIIDIYVLTTDYVRRINYWIASNFKTGIPSAPNAYELKKLMKPLEDKATIADHVSYIPAKFKFLFGSAADLENQATFKVIKRENTSYTDSEIKTAVSMKVNEYFKLENWEFGDTFYFSELAAYLHMELGDYISSVVITPKYTNVDFTKLLSITCDQNEIFLSVTTSNDVKIISKITQTELTGE